MRNSISKHIFVMHSDPLNDEDVYPVNNSLHGFGRGLFVSTTDAEILQDTFIHEDPAPRRGASTASGQELEYSMMGITDTFSKFSPGNPSNTEVLKSGRTQSLSQFLQDGNIAASLSMKKQLQRLLDYVQIHQPERHLFFRQEMENFQDLFTRFLAQKNTPPLLWTKVESLSNDKVV